MAVEVRFKVFFCLAILLFCCLLAYWPLTFSVFSLKNDALNYFLPVRYQISEAISTGHWPFWSPYFNLGYPLHGDMQSGVWSPVVQLFSLFGVYTLKTLQYETLFYVYLSGVGMFFLLEQFRLDRLICLLGSASYMLCGFNSDSAQFLNWISSAAFIPFTFLFYYRAVTRPSWKEGVFCGFFLYLLFVTGYPADFIITCYVLLIFFCWYFFINRKFAKVKIINLFTTQLIIATIFILLSLPAIISFLEFLPLSERGKGASYSQALSNPLHPILLFSWIAPLPVWKAHFAAITDPLTRNSYFGIVAFLLVVISFLTKTSSPLLRFFKWSFIVSIFFSFGAWGLIRSFAYYVLPLMNTFRHPSNARIFSIFFACIIAAIALQSITKTTDGKSTRKYAWIILCTAFGLLAAWACTGRITIFSLIHTPNMDAQALKNFLASLTFSDLLFFNILLQLPFVAALYFWFVQKVHIQRLILLGLLNLIVHVVFFQPFTVVKKDSVKTIQNILNNLSPKGYPLPDLNVSPVANSMHGEDHFLEIGAANMYNKKIGRIDYRITPSNLNAQNKFWYNEPLKNILFQYPLLYRADSAHTTFNSNQVDSSLTKKIVIVENMRSVQFVNSSDSAGYTAITKRFTPNAWNFEISSEKRGFYCLFQNHYPRWHLYVDGKKTNIEKCNDSFMGFALPAGIHRVQFRYYHTDLVISFWISLGITMVILIMGLVAFNKRYSIKFFFPA